MGKCPYCDETITTLRTDVLESHGTGDAPFAILVLLISCSRCDKVLGVLHPR